ncbi:hypothetical protein BN1723_020629, partial [Verticillium longisporum]
LEGRQGPHRRPARPRQEGLGQRRDGVEGRQGRLGRGQGPARQDGGDGHGRRVLLRLARLRRPQDHRGREQGGFREGDARDPDAPQRREGRRRRGDGGR